MDQLLTPPPFLDWQLVICLFALFGMAVGAIGYFSGRCHGWEIGYEAGCADEITRHKPKIIQAKKEAANIARVLCLAQLNHPREPISTNTQS